MLTELLTTSKRKFIRLEIKDKGYIDKEVADQIRDLPIL